MDYWIHIREVPTGGGGRNRGPDWGRLLTYLGCFGFLVVVVMLWIFFRHPELLAGIVRRLLPPVTIILLGGSVAIIIRAISVSEFKKDVLIPGAIALAAGFLLGAITVARGGGSIGTVIFTGIMIGVIVAAPAMLFGLAGFDLGGVIAGIAGFTAGFLLGRWIDGNGFNIGIYIAAIAIDLYFCKGDVLD